MGSMNKERLNEVKDSRDKTRKKTKKKHMGLFFLLLLAVLIFIRSIL